jgi:isocitrate dehydrogenase
LAESQAKIVADFAAQQGSPADIGGYYHPDAAKTEAVMRPSATLNQIIG